MGFGMQYDDVHQISNNIVTALEEYFNDQIEGYSVYDIMDVPHQMFTISITLYNYYNLAFKYNRGKSDMA